MTDFTAGLFIFLFIIVPVLGAIVAVVLVVLRKISIRTMAVILGLAIVLFILGGLLVPETDHATESSRRARCLNNLRQIAIAMIQYADDNNGNYPSALVDDSEPAQRRMARLLKSGAITDPRIFHCPSASFKSGPDTAKLEDKDLTKCDLANIADVYLDNDWCSYGLDPRLKKTDPATRALIADRPDPRYWGTGVNSPPAGQPGSNSANHKGDGQNVVYNDGHIEWSATCIDDSGIDPNIYSANPEISPAEDSNIDFGPKPPSR